MMPSVWNHRVDLNQYLKGMAPIVRVCAKSARPNFISQARPGDVMSK